MRIGVCVGFVCMCVYKAAQVGCAGALRTCTPV